MSGSAQANVTPLLDAVGLKEDQKAKVMQYLAAATPDPWPAGDPDSDRMWSAENPNVVTHGQPAIQIYLNELGHVVIRQERSWSDDEDQCVYLDPLFVDAFVDKLMTEVAKAKEAKRS